MPKHFSDWNFYSQTLKRRQKIKCFECRHLPPSDTGVPHIPKPNTEHRWVAVFCAVHESNSVFWMVKKKTEMRNMTKEEHSVSNLGCCSPLQQHSYRLQKPEDVGQDGLELANSMKAELQKEYNSGSEENSMKGRLCGTNDAGTVE